MVELQTRQGLLQQPRLSRWVESVNPTKSPIPSSCFRTRAGTLRGTRCLSMEVYALSNGRRKTRPIHRYPVDPAAKTEQDTVPKHDFTGILDDLNRGDAQHRIDIMTILS